MAWGAGGVGVGVARTTPGGFAEHPASPAYPVLVSPTPSCSEYRHVVLPQDIAKRLPKDKLLSEAEWRALGVQQSRGWGQLEGMGTLEILGRADCFLQAACLLAGGGVGGLNMRSAAHALEGDACLAPSS